MDFQQLFTEKLGLAENTFLGQTVVITGAGRGIGLETARAFSRLGGRVILAEISDSGQEVETRLRQAGGDARFIRTDVSDEASVAHLAEVTRQAYGSADIVINNAILCPVCPVVDLQPAVWDQVIAVNLRGTFLVSKAFLPDMLARGKGTLINMVSTDAMPGLAAYIASKQGIVGFSQTLAAEVGERGVRVIPFSPGMVDTPSIREVSGPLAPLLGITREQFLNVSLHAAYSGLMPAEHAAAATVYLAARLVDELQGQLVNGYEVLERAGLIHASEIDTPEPAQPASRQVGQNESLPLAQAAARELAEILAATEAEFNQLPVFVRPMARGGFQSKSGHSLPDWQRSITLLIENLERIRSADPAARAWLARVNPDLRARLGKLSDYYRDVPAQTARFTRDTEFLKEVRRVSEARLATLQTLVTCLETLA